MRYLSEYAQINCRFTEVNDTQSAAEELVWMEKNYKQQAKLIKFDNIEKHSLGRMKEELYDVVSMSAGFNTRLSV